MFDEDAPKLIEQWQAREPTIGLSYIDLLHSRPGHAPPAFAVADNPAPTDGGVSDAARFVPPPPDPSRTERLTRIGIDGQAVGGRAG